MSKIRTIARFAAVVVFASAATLEAANAPGSVSRHWPADNGKSTYSNPRFLDANDKPITQFTMTMSDAANSTTR